MMYALYHSCPSVRKIINSSLVSVPVFSSSWSLLLWHKKQPFDPSHNHICTHRLSNTTCFTMEIFFDLNYYNYFVLFVVFLIASIYLFKNKKNRPPGPFGLPILGHLYLFNSTPLPLSLKELSDRYGPIILLRFGSKPVLVVTSPSAVEECFTKNDVIFANRPPFICGNYLGYDFTSLEWAPYGHHWKNLRRITNIEIFSSISLQASSTIRNEEVRFFIRKLFKEYTPSSSVERFQNVDLTSKLYEMALVFIMKMVAGRRHFGDEKWSSDTVKETFLPTRLMSKVDFLPILRLIGYQGTEKFMLNMRRKKDAFLDALLEEHRKGDINRDERKKNKTMIDALLSLQQEDPDFYTDENIKGIVGVMFAAGVETSVTAMIWAMSLLLNHPEELAKLRAELDLHVEEGRLLCDSDLSKLPYLHCVINETLRLHPPAPITLPHQSSEECKVGGYDIPRGTTLIVNAWAIHRDPKLWVEATRFMPERFENGKEEKEGFKWLAFGTGRRGCPGSGLAYRVVGLTIGTLIHCFDWKKAAEETLLMRQEVEPYGSMYKPRQGKMNLLSNLMDN